MRTITIRHRDLRERLSIPSHLPFRRGRRDPPAVPLALGRADLRDQDLRGLDLTGASLAGADLRGARTGIRPAWMALLVTIALAGSLAVGAASGWAGATLRHLLSSPDSTQRVIGGIVTSYVVLLLAGSLQRGMRATERRMLPPILVLSALATVTGWLLGGTGAAGVAMLALSLAIYVLVVLGTLARTLAGTFGQVLFVVVALSGALVGKLLGGGFPAAAIALGAMVLGRRSLSGDQRSPSVARVAVDLACAFGTSFRGADLRGAQLDGAVLAYTDVEHALLDPGALQHASVRTCKLDSSADVGDRRVP